MYDNFISQIIITYNIYRRLIHAHIKYVRHINKELLRLDHRENKTVSHLVKYLLPYIFFVSINKIILLNYITLLLLN